MILHVSGIQNRIYFIRYGAFYFILKLVCSILAGWIEREWAAKRSGYTRCSTVAVTFLDVFQMKNMAEETDFILFILHWYEILILT